MKDENLIQDLEDIHKKIHSILEQCGIKDFDSENKTEKEKISTDIWSPKMSTRILDKG